MIFYSKWLTKAKYFIDLSPYTCVYGFFFVPLHAQL